jgi:hypothetical protein
LEVLTPLGFKVRRCIMSTAVMNTIPSTPIAEIPEPKYSHIRVIKRGIHYMVDAVDPILKGAKAGFYSLHGISTWKREVDDHKLECDSKGWAVTAGLLVTTAELAAYGLATKELVKHEGMEGYALLALPLVMQGASYTREAFRRSRRTELSNLVFTKIQRSFDKPNGEYDLTNQQLVERVATYISPKRNKSEQWEEVDDEGAHWVVTERSKTRASGDKTTDAQEQAKKYVMATANSIFNDLFADDKVGGKYRMTAGLVAGPRKETYDRRIEQNDYRTNHYARGELKCDVPFVQDVIADVVKEHKGSANIELLGQVTSVIEGSRQLATYEVKSSRLWKKR